MGPRMDGIHVRSANHEDARALAGTAEIAATYVQPERWRSGIGAALLETVLGRLRRDGYGDVTAWVLARNEPALGFYRRFGFEPDRNHARSDRVGEVELRLRARLRD